MGRRPRSTLLKVMLGAPSKEHTNYSEPLPATNIGKPSEWLTEEQQQIWIYLVANAPKGLLKQMDRSALEVFVVSADIYRRTAMQLSAQKSLLSKRSAQLLNILNRESRVLRQYGTELGTTPAARPRIQVTPEPDAAKSEFEKLMG